MNKILFLISFLLIRSFSVHAANPITNAKTKKNYYCGDNLEFHVPALINKKSIEKQSESYTCKYGLILINKKGNKKTRINVDHDSEIYLDAFDKQYLDQYKKNKLNHLSSVYQNIRDVGETTILTHYWLDEIGNLKEIQKDYFFRRRDFISASAIYKANPNNQDDILFMNALEQLFLSMENNWKKDGLSLGD